MDTEIRMPDLGTADAEIAIVEWLIEVGQPVARGQMLLAAETDKAAVEVESIATGVLKEIRAAAGERVPAGDVIAIVEVEGDDKASTVPLPAPEPAAAVDAMVAEPTPEQPATPMHTQPSGPKRAKKGLFARNRQGAARGGAKREESGRRPAGLRDNRSAVARRLSQSHRQIIPFDMVCRIEMSAAARQREALEVELGRPVGYDAFFIHAIARIVQDLPCFLSYELGDGMETHEQVNVGFAVGFDRALHMPVVREADNKALAEIEGEVARLALNAARGKLLADELSGACVMVSNLSSQPIQSFHAVIPPGSSAALAVGGIEDAPVVRDGAVVAVLAAQVTLTADHRVINGRNAAQFLTHLKERLETP